MIHYLFGNSKMDFYYGVVSGTSSEEAYKKAAERFKFSDVDHEDITVSFHHDGPDYDFQERAKKILLENHQQTSHDDIQSFMDKLDNPFLRQEINRAYGYALPTRDTLKSIYGYGPLLEIGAGTGYWAKMIASNGQKIIATDEIQMGSKNEWIQQIGLHHPVETIDGVDAVKKYPGMSVLMVWPTQHHDLAAAVMEAMPKGTNLLLVHDRKGGMIGTPAMHDVLNRSFEYFERIPLPNYPFFDDVFKTYFKVRD